VEIFVHVWPGGPPYEMAITDKLVYSATASIA
jgi:hypothetical protein